MALVTPQAMGIWSWNLRVQVTSRDSCQDLQLLCMILKILSPIPDHIIHVLEPLLNFSWESLDMLKRVIQLGQLFGNHLAVFGQFLYVCRFLL